MNEWIKPEIIIALIALVISMISLIWQIIVACDNNKIKLDVNCTFLPTVNYERTKKEACFSLKLVNKGKQEIVISSIELNFCGESIILSNHAAEGFSFVDNEKELPINIQSRGMKKNIYNLNTILNVIDGQLTDEDSVCFLIRDTLDNQYFSSKFSIGKMKKEIQRLENISFK